MRLGWLLLLFPSAAFAIAGCPVGVQLGNVTIATRLPVCLKFDSSQLGGCLVDCKGVCVELPLANTKGPVETTGTACSITENGSGNGDSDGSGNTPDEGPSGTKPISGWLDFEPVIGDATGTSVSGAVAKLNKNLGVALRQVVEGSKQDSGNLNSIAHSAESFSRDMKTSLAHLDRMANDIYQSKNTTTEILGRINTSNDLLQSINSKMGSSGSGSGSSEGSQSGIESFLKPKFDELFGKFDRAYYGAQVNVSNHTGSLLSEVASINGALGMNGMAGQIKQMNESMQHLASVMSGGSTGGSGGGSTGTSDQYLKQIVEGMGYLGRDVRGISQALQNGGGSGGNGVDYSQMPGSGNNPLSVGAAHYNSACAGGDCFFDVAAIQKKLDEANKAISDKYQDIGDEVRDIFDFQLSGSAGVIECFDFFTYGGKDYRVCPPAKEYWNIIAALMMFIFYFIAFAIVFKR
ncbi:hypothetical protein NXY55_03735 [Aeromonas veronii]|nr:hypothetical protein [Aeromonas veronii]